MINRKIVLVLGAGASMPFGFPSGTDLKAKIIQGLDQAIVSPSMLPSMREAGFGTADTERFRSALYKSGKRSVDAFLERRTDFMPVGKTAIACALLPCEQEHRLFDSSQNWYEYLFNKLSTTFEQFARNSVSIVTFNYDRSLEHYLFTALSNSYGKRPEECADVLRAIPIVHLYGTLGAFPPTHGGGMDFGTRPTGATLIHSAEQIHIIHEDVAGKPEFDRAHGLLREAELVCFLGFGYDPTNLSRLLKYGADPQQEVIGTAVGLTGRECNLVYESLSRYGFRKINLGNWDALGILRELCPFE